MRALQNFSLVWIVAVLLVSCTSMGRVPETPTEVLYAAEQSYGAALDTVIRAKTEGRLTPENVLAVDEVFTAYDTAKPIAKAAIASGDTGEFDAQMLLINGSIAALRSIALEASQ